MGGTLRNMVSRRVRRQCIGPPDPLSHAHGGNDDESVGKWWTDFSVVPYCHHGRELGCSEATEAIILFLSAAGADNSRQPMDFVAGPVDCCVSTGGDVREEDAE